MRRLLPEALGKDMILPDKETKIDLLEDRKETTDEVSKA